jgi:hypothetical protein
MGRELGGFGASAARAGCPHPVANGQLPSTYSVAFTAALTGAGGMDTCSLTIFHDPSF